MIDLCLLRHGIAEDAGPRTGHRDEPRALTEDGRARMVAATAGLARLGLEIDLVLTSPLTRCVQSAEIVCEAIGGEPVEDERLGPGMDTGDLLETLLERPDSHGVLVCAHQPSLSIVAADLIGGGEIEFKKGSVAVLALDGPRPGAGTLRGLYPPSALRRLGRG